MFNWFKSKPKTELRKPGQPLHAPDVKLVSLHIPKTAGTSFRNMLKQVYGEEAVVRFDINQQGHIKINEEDFEEASVPNGVVVLHGHFHAHNFKKLVQLNRDVPWITWLRHPVDRVISNYYYLDGVLSSIIKQSNRALNIQSKMQRTLLEYAQSDIARNVISKFLKGIELEELAFIGLQESLDVDLPKLAHALDWSDQVEILQHNKTPSKRDISKEVRAQIAAWNTEDMKLYDAALELRQKRGWA